MIDAVIFDIGNVLLKFDYFIAARRLMELNGLTELPAREPIVAAKEALEGGAIDRAEFLRRVRPSFHHTGSDTEFVEIWEDIFEENQPMTALASELSGQLPTYLLSNISDIHLPFIFARYPVFRTFRDGVYSYRVGSLKPDPAIYLAAMAQFGILPERTVFIDDLAANVAAAATLGFRAVQYDFNNHAALVDTLHDWGIRVGESPSVNR